MVVQIEIFFTENNKYKWYVFCPGFCEYAALKLKEDYFIFIFSETPEKRLRHCHISFAGKPIFILG